MFEFWITAAAVTGTGCGFLAGYLHAASRLPHLIAQLPEDDVRHVAKMAGRIRRGDNT